MGDCTDDAIRVVSPYEGHESRPHGMASRPGRVWRGVLHGKGTLCCVLRVVLSRDGQAMGRRGDEGAVVRWYHELSTQIGRNIEGLFLRRSGCAEKSMWKGICKVGADGWCHGGDRGRA